MLCIVLFLCILMLKDINEIAGKEYPKYEDFYFYGEYDNVNVTYMMMPEDNGIVVSAILKGQVPEETQTEKTINILLWTRKNRKVPERITYTASTKDGFKFKNLDLTRKTIFLIHGFIDKNFESDFFKVMREVFLRKDNYNIIGIDWSELSKIPWYAEGVKNSYVAGTLTAQAIKDFKNLYSADSPYINVITFNLGGLVAQAATLSLKSKIDRITALDPPYILTQDLPANRKLSRKSAKLLEVIHTSGDYLGINEAVGHRDFYPNGGKWQQPGCYSDIADRCSSRMSFIYYGRAVLGKNNYLATLCSDYDAYKEKKCLREPKIQLFNNISQR